MWVVGKGGILIIQPASPYLNSLLYAIVAIIFIYFLFYLGKKNTLKVIFSFVLTFTSLLLLLLLLLVIVDILLLQVKLIG